MTDLTDITTDLASIDNDAAIYDELNFDRRTDAIDFIDFHILDRIENLRHNAGTTNELDLLKHQTQKLKQQLENIDKRLFEQLRQNIRAGSSFKEIIHKYFDRDAIETQPDQPGYDNLDNFINGLLCYDPLPEATTIRDAEMVFYQQTPARIIFQLVEMARLKSGDVFFDIGSGLGQVGMLVNLLTGATTHGVEYEPAYCNYAKTCAANLNLSDVQFINIDARNADYSSGSVFFMYTPFEGNMLQQVLGILQQQAKQRPIRIFTYGPCSPQVAKQPWLTCTSGDGSDIYKLYEFKS